MPLRERQAFSPTSNIAGLFSGYINWDDGLLISRRAAELRGNKCPQCGGEVELSGKGVVSCPYCGTEVFLT